MSIWTDKNGKQHISLMAGGQRVHRRVPEGASAGDAKQLQAELRVALGKKRAPRIPGDPQLAEVMGLYLQHCDTLRSPETARYHALRLGPWVEGRRASEARQVAASVIKDMRAHYAASSSLRTSSKCKPVVGSSRM